jgi:hypothetical protein
MNLSDDGFSSSDQEANLLEINLSLTPEQRILKHQKALNLLNILKRVRKDGERSQLPTESSPQ